MHEEFNKRVNDFQDKIRKVKNGQTDFRTFTNNLDDENMFILRTLIFRFALWLVSI